MLRRLPSTRRAYAASVKGRADEALVAEPVMDPNADQVRRRCATGEDKKGCCESACWWAASVTWGVMGAGAPAQAAVRVRAHCRSQERPTGIMMLRIRSVCLRPRCAAAGADAGSAAARSRTTGSQTPSSRSSWMPSASTRAPSTTRHPLSSARSSTSRSTPHRSRATSR
eukprot:1885076-Rhodomonas_salina.2